MYDYIVFLNNQLIFSFFFDKHIKRQLLLCPEFNLVVYVFNVIGVKLEYIFFPSYLFTWGEKFPYSKFFWPAYSGIRTEYGEIRCISQYPVRMRENTDQKNSDYGHFSRSDKVVNPHSSLVKESVLFMKAILVTFRITVFLFKESHFSCKPFNVVINFSMLVGSNHGITSP